MSEAEFLFPELELEAWIENSIEVLRFYEPKDRPYYGCFSGGKDSIVMHDLVKRSGVHCDWHYNVVGIDPPELVQFIRAEYPHVEWVRPKKHFFTEIHTHGLPTRKKRWCCQALKENNNPAGSTVLIGVRAHESPRRAATWKPFQADRKSKTNGKIVCPILYWATDHIWRYIRENALKYPSLYDDGYERIGCVGCPMSKNPRAQIDKYPKIKQAYLQAARRFHARKIGTGSSIERVFKNGDEYFEWWLSDCGLPKDDDCQGTLEFWA